VSATAKKVESIITMEPGVVAHLPLDVIDFDPDQPRKDVPDDHIEALAADIKGSRVKQPITVRPNPDAPGRYVIKYGECRFRASHMAGKPTIPALLDTEEETQGDALSRLLDQVKENHIRRDLNPMEWAGVLRRMRNDHRIKSIAAIEETLKTHGITNMGRAYISNIMRLEELPEWAQELIRAGKLTTAHGKYLLPATSSEKVIEALRVALAEDDEQPSVRQLQDKIFRLFMQYHTALDGYWQPFDYKVECVQAGCQKMRKVSTETQSGNTFCLDGACFKAKEKEARASQQNGDGATKEPVLPVVAEDGTVNIDEQDVDWTPLINAQFDTAACERCEHRHTGVWKSYGDEESRAPGCFDPTGECFREKTRQAMAERNRKQAAEQVIENWLRQAVAREIAENADAQLAVIGACALNLNGFAWALEGAMDKAAEEAGVESIADLLPDGLLRHGPTITRELLQAAEFEILLPLANEVGIGIDAWQPAEDWFSDKTNDELVELLIEIGAYDETDRARLNGLTSNELIERGLDHAEKVPAPAEIREAWERLTASSQRTNDGEKE